MSITLMSEVWPLDLPPTDKSVFVALADSANDQDGGKTWIPITSRQPVTRGGRVKLTLTVKTGLGETAIRGAIKRLVAAGHLSREEKPGLGVTYWVHPIANPTPSSSEVAWQKSPSADAATPSGGETPPLGSRGENLRKPNKPSTGARALRRARPPAAPLDGPATAELQILHRVVERETEGQPEAKVRAAIRVAAQGPCLWLERCGLKCAQTISNNGAFGLQVFCWPGDRLAVEAVELHLKLTASKGLKRQCSWVSIRDGKRRG